MEQSVHDRGEPTVVYEDESLVAVVKPPRMHSAPGLGSGDLCAWTFARFPDVADVSIHGAGSKMGPGRSDRAEGGLLHRLDYETSGLVLFARNAAVRASLIDQQARGTFYKEYLAASNPSRRGPIGSSPPLGTPEGVARGAWEAARSSLDDEAILLLLREPALPKPCSIVSSFRPFGPKGAQVACLGPMEGGAAVYHSDILSSCRLSNLSLGPSGMLELRMGLSRGFRHQIRAHLSWIGLPIAGDRLYGGAVDERLRLYAVKLAFEHPGTGERLSICAEP